MIPLAVRVLGTFSVDMFTLRKVTALDALLLKKIFINKIYLLYVFVFLHHVS